MKRSLKSLMGHAIAAVDGRAGEARDALIDERDWSVTYLVARRTGWPRFNVHYISKPQGEGLPDDVLIRPESLETPEVGWLMRPLPTRMTREEVDHCPGLGSDAPKSVLYEEEFNRFLGHAPYDHRPNTHRIQRRGSYEAPESAYDRSDNEIQEHVDNVLKIAAKPLRSGVELLGYEVSALDGFAGRVADLIIDVERWRVESIVASVGTLGRKALLDRHRARSISWSDRRLSVDMTLAEFEASPRYRPHEPVNADADGHAYDFRGLPCLLG